MRFRLSRSRPSAAAGLLLLSAIVPIAAWRAAPAAPAPSVPDAVYVHGKVVTVDGASRVAEAFAVKGDRFVAVGSSREVRALAGRETRIVDLRGRTVVPGLIDNHNHQYDVALVTLRGVHLRDVPSLAELLARLRRAVTAARPGETIFTTVGWSADAFPEKRGPTRQELDAVSADHPIIVYSTRSRVQANSAALKALAIGRETAGGDRLVVGKDAAGEPDGALSGSPAAFQRVLRRLVPPPTLEEKTAILTKIQAQQHAMGLTGIRDLQIDPDVMRAYYELWRTHRLTLRTSVGLNVNAGEEDRLEHLLDAWGVGPGFGDEWLRIDGIAEYNPGEQLREPYADRDGKDIGELRLPEDRFRQAILAINRHGWRRRSTSPATARWTSCWTRTKRPIASGRSATAAGSSSTSRWSTRIRCGA